MWGRERLAVVSKCFEDGLKAGEPFAVLRIVDKGSPDEFAAVAMDQMFRCEPANFEMVGFYPGNRLAFVGHADGHTGRISTGCVGGDLGLARSEGENPISTPPLGKHSRVKHVCNEVPVVFFGEAGDALQEVVVCKSRSDEDVAPVDSIVRWLGFEGAGRMQLALLEGRWTDREGKVAVGGMSGKSKGSTVCVHGDLG